MATKKAIKNSCSKKPVGLNFDDGKNNTSHNNEYEKFR